MATGPGKIKVYHWLDHHAGAQADMIVAARSKAEVGRIRGLSVAQLFNISETGNAEEVAIATEVPGKVYYKPTRSGFRAPWRPLQRQ